MTAIQLMTIMNIVATWPVTMYSRHHSTEEGETSIFICCHNYVLLMFRIVFLCSVVKVIFFGIEAKLFSH